MLSLYLIGALCLLLLLLCEGEHLYQQDTQRRQYVADLALAEPIPLPVPASYTAVAVSQQELDRLITEADAAIAEAEAWINYYSQCLALTRRAA